MNTGKKQAYKKNAFINEEIKALTPQQIAVIIALFTKVLKVRAVILDVNQTVEVVLAGDLKSKEVNDLLKKLNNVPVDKWLNMLQKFN
ncbi:hypothetical protein SAMN05518684_101228 [Salipaludibacillus aurantiacus]|uniref:Uncharacterized protein n=2 Tax=Salipaludibacillus aurantiacus TaxID=1601833 RepID=A0A1H9PC03_9BACI|nr:hypothetical protein SAMN05518684_101228 [Salipaludibacillus aurantiacus]